MRLLIQSPQEPADVGPMVITVFREGNWGSGSLDVLLARPLLSPCPGLGVGMQPKSGSLESLWDFTAPTVPRSWPCPPSQQGGSQSGSGEREATHKKEQGEDPLAAPVGPSTRLCLSWTLLSSVSSSVPFYLMLLKLSSCHLKSPDQ